MFDFIRRTRVNVPVINILLPAPGTKIFERLNHEGRLLVRNENDYLRNALSYAISCRNCFYKPASLTAQEVEEGLIKLRRRLSSLSETTRRSIIPDASITALLLAMNIEFRHETRRIVQARMETDRNFALRTASPVSLAKLLFRSPTAISKRNKEAK